jgi:phage shock protein PspC (stress-responsive transcriptional regulator)
MREPVTGQVRQPLREWNRDLEEKKIAGVCAGISSQMDIPVTVVRAIFVVLALPTFSGLGIVLYLALWFLMPASLEEESGLDRVVGAVNSLAGDISSRRTDDEDPPQDHTTIRHDPL